MRKSTEMLEIDLRLFDGAAGAAAGTAGEGGAGEGAAQATESALPKAETQRPGRSRRAKTGAYENVVFGKQDAAETETTSPDAVDNNGGGNANTSGVTTTSDTLEAKRKAFDELISGEYRDMYAEKFQQAFNRRFKEVKGMEDSLNAQKPILELLMQKYRIADGDIGKLQKAIEQDDTYWEAGAEEAGLTVEQYRAMQKLERENEEFRRMQQRTLGEQQARQKLAEWQREADALKELYPTFDLNAEVKNPDFLGLLKAGVDIKHAYELRHMDEIKEAAARSAAQQAGLQVAAKLKSKALRPSENGTSSQSAVIVKSDVHSLTRADRAEAARQAAMGKRIEF